MDNKTPVAEHLRDNAWAVRPVRKLGTMGWFRDGTPWACVFVSAKSHAEAIVKAKRAAKRVKADEFAYLL